MRLPLPILLCMLSLLLAKATNAATLQDETTERPNIVWIMSEDNSKHYLKLFDDAGAETPNIAAMASSGVLFKRAFSNAPVCSVARTTLITGCYAPRLGTHFHRRIKSASLPADFEMFPALLRRVGYYTTNNAKEDYNCDRADDVWDESSRKADWRNRQQGQPFFHVKTFTDSHESSLHFKQKWVQKPDLQTDPVSVELAPYHPDTELFRLTYARYHDRIKVIDQKVGTIIQDLEDAGQLENTFVFYFGDHGGVLPRGKGYVYESGLHVPLVVRIPEKWKTGSPYPRKSQVDGFVEFVDFGPTVLQLAGVEVPSTMDGRPFLGAGVSAKNVDARRETLGYADRMDEKYDMCRSLRVGDWKYVRNYQAIYPDGLWNNYRYEMLAYREWAKKSAAGELTESQNAFFQKKPVEQLFDLSKDPHEVNDVSQDPKNRARLETMHQRLSEKLLAMNDLGFIPESILVDDVDEPFVEYGKRKAASIKTYLETADLALEFSRASSSNASDSTVEEKTNLTLEKLKNAIGSEDPIVRYWAWSVCSTAPIQTLPVVAPASKASFADESLVVRIRAAEFAAIGGNVDPSHALDEIFASSESSTVNLIALQTWVLLQDPGFGFDLKFKPDVIKAVDSQVLRRIGFLSGMSAKETKDLVRKRMRADRLKQNRKKNDWP